MSSSRPSAEALEDERLPVRHSWSESSRFLPRTFVRPAQQFMRIEAAAGIVMLVAAVAALLMANSPLHDAYESLWTTEVELRVGPVTQFDHLTLRDWVNDGAMALFFFLVVLEIKRELVSGELRNPRAAALPVFGALGGMVLPALLYLGFTAGGPAAAGWGIPMATDIAFVAAVVALAGRRVPPAAKIFLLSLAIVDDLGAIAVIAIFYSHGGSVLALSAAVLTIAVAAGLVRMHVRSRLPYALLAIVCWVALHEGGVHPTLAGVAFGFLTPTWSFYDPHHFPARARNLVDEVARSFHDDVFDQHEYERTQVRLHDLVRLSTETAAPLDRLEHALAPWVSFLIVPLFAFANAGLPLSGAWAAGGDVGQRAALGVAVGLVIGKTLGIAAAAWLACRSGVAQLPTGTGWRHIVALSCCAGIGFTVSLFVTDLAFSDAALILSAKIGVLAGSMIAGVAGFLLLRTCQPPPDAPPPAPSVSSSAGPAAQDGRAAGG